MQTVVTTAELFFLHHVRTSAASAVGKHHTCAGQGRCIYLDGATCILMVLQNTLAQAEELARAWITPLELAACIHLATFATTASLPQDVLAMLWRLIFIFFLKAPGGSHEPILRHF